MINEECSETLHTFCPPIHHFVSDNDCKRCFDFKNRYLQEPLCVRAYSAYLEEIRKFFKGIISVSAIRSDEDIVYRCIDNKQLRIKNKMLILCDKLLVFVSKDEFNKLVRDRSVPMPRRLYDKWIMLLLILLRHQSFDASLYNLIIFYGKLLCSSTYLTYDQLYEVKKLEKKESEVRR